MDRFDRIAIVAWLIAVAGLAWLILENRYVLIVLLSHFLH